MEPYYLWVGFQSPSLRGSGRFVKQGGCLRKRNSLRVSIPFIAGQWSLRRPSGDPPRLRAAFQSPSLRGSGRFGADRPAPPSERRCFNPLHCGAVVASGEQRAPRRTSLRFNPLHCGAVVASVGRRAGEGRAVHVSIPFIAGQWSLHGGRRGGPALSNVSIPFIAGQWSLRLRCAGRRALRRMSQSPSLRGSGRFLLPDPVCLTLQ